MLQSLRLKNFRNFQQQDVTFAPWMTLIIWNNGAGKTNILEALSYPSHCLLESQPLYLVKKWETLFHLSYSLANGSCRIFYDAENNKKTLSIGEKKCSKQSLASWYPHIIAFHPLMMNLMYLSPSDRRNFLDEILVQTFPHYQKILSWYKKILLGRNKVLKNISEWFSSKQELSFWNQEFVHSAEQIYSYREKIIHFFQENIESLRHVFWEKIYTLSLKYLSHIDPSNAKEELQEYIEANYDKEVLLKKSLRWPHLDDFCILVDDTPLTHFASRGEVKSIILWLKLQSKEFISQYSQKNVLYLIDDILSELDHSHIQQICDSVGETQCIITSIQDHDIPAQKIYL